MGPIFSFIFHEEQWMDIWGLRWIAGKTQKLVLEERDCNWSRNLTGSALR